MKLNTKDIGFVNFNNQSISWIKFNAVKVWEAFKKYFVSGVAPLTFENSVGQPLVDYKIYGNLKQRRLPDEYQEVEYIETTATQYIDTNVPLKSGLKMIVDWVYKDPSSGNSYTGGHIGSPGNRWLVGSQRNGYYYFAVGASNVATEFKYGNRDIVEAYWADKASYIKVNGVESKSVNFKSYALSEEPNYSFYLGATNRNGSPASRPQLTIYSCKLYQDEILLRDYIPCYRKSDSAIGLYDLINDEFYPNSGTGTFLKGVDVPSPSAPVEIKSVNSKIDVDINGNITTINLDEPLRKGGNYADYIDYENQKVVRKIASVQFDGTENWTLYKNITGGSVFALDNTLNPLIKSYTTDTFMTHFALTNVYSTASFPVGVYRFGFNQDNLQITSTRLYVSTEHTSIDAFKVWLAENKPIVEFPSATPIEETISLPQIETYVGANTLSINTEIQPSNIEITYKGK